MPEGRLGLTIVGSAAAWSRQPGRASSCYLVELDGHGLVLDLGQGSFSALSAYRDPQEVRAILVSHLHPDHGIDLIPLRHYLRYGCQPPASVELYAPDGLRHRYDVLVGEEDFLSALPGDRLEPGTVELAPFEVTVAPVTHREPSFAFRVAPLRGATGQPSAPDDRPGAPPGLVYSGDCGREDDLLPLIEQGDTLLCEAFFGTGEPVAAAQHLTAAQAARAASEGGAGRLLLTHLKDGIDVQAAVEAARRVFSGPVEVARPGLEVAIA